MTVHMRTRAFTPIQIAEIVRYDVVKSVVYELRVDMTERRRILYEHHFTQLRCYRAAALQYERSRTLPREKSHSLPRATHPRSPPTCSLRPFGRCENAGKRENGQADCEGTRGLPALPNAQEIVPSTREELRVREEMVSFSLLDPSSI